MVKANLYRKKITQRSIHIHSQKEKKEEKKNIYIKKGREQANR